MRVFDAESAEVVLHAAGACLIDADRLVRRGGGALIALLAACSDPGLLRVEDPAVSLADHASLVGPTRLPIADADGAAVEVRVSVPEGTWLRTAPLADGRIGLVFPPGSVADRVEWRGTGADRRVVDVRGTRLVLDGDREHHVYQARGSTWVGVAWPAGDAAASDAALDRFVAALRPHRSDSWEATYRSKHGCDGCHAVDRADNRRPRERGLVNRGTDAHGWFTPSTALALDAPAEAYGHTADAADPALTPSCAAHTGARCDDGSVLRWTLDLPAALADGSAHAAAYCGAVSWVANHLDPADSALAPGGALWRSPCLTEAISSE